MPHSQTHAPLHSAYELVVLRNKLQLWFWNEMCGQTIQVRNFQKAQKPIKFYLKPYWRGFYLALVAKGRNWNCQQSDILNRE